MGALFAVLAVGGLALGIYELGQAQLKRRGAAAKSRAAARALADKPGFTATARLLKSRRSGSQVAFSGLAIDPEGEKLALVCPGSSTIDSYLEGRIDRGALDEAIDGSGLRQSLRAYLRRKLRRMQTPTAADGAALTEIIDRHAWSCDLIERPLRSAVVELADVIEAEVIADGKCIAKAARSGPADQADRIVRQVAARLLANRNCVGVFLKILVNDLEEPLFLLDLCDSAQRPPVTAEDSLEEALRWHEILRVVLTRRRGEAVAARGDRSAVAGADPLAKALKAATRA